MIIKFYGIAGFTNSTHNYNSPNPLTLQIFIFNMMMEIARCEITNSPVS